MGMIFHCQMGMLTLGNTDIWKIFSSKCECDSKCKCDAMCECDSKCKCDY